MKQDMQPADLAPPFETGRTSRAYRVPQVLKLVAGFTGMGLASVALFSKGMVVLWLLSEASVSVADTTFAFLAYALMQQILIPVACGVTAFGMSALAIHRSSLLGLAVSTPCVAAFMITLSLLNSTSNSATDALLEVIIPIVLTCVALGWATRALSGLALRHQQDETQHGKRASVRDLFEFSLLSALVFCLFRNFDGEDRLSFIVVMATLSFLVSSSLACVLLSQRNNSQSKTLLTVFWVLHLLYSSAFLLLIAVDDDTDLEEPWIALIIIVFSTLWGWLWFRLSVFWIHRCGYSLRK